MVPVITFSGKSKWIKSSCCTTPKTSANDCASKEKALLDRWLAASSLRNMHLYVSLKHWQATSRRGFPQGIVFLSSSIK